MSREAISLERGADGIAWVVFGDPNAKVNIFNTGNVTLLDRILDELAANNPKRVVFISGKPNTFIAGADIKVTRDLIRAGNLIKIEVLDHVIVGRSSHTSLRQLGYFYS